jgi:cell division protein FtsZ
MGKAMMGTGEASGEDRAIQAAEKAIANPLLDEISLNGARGVLINITGGNDLTLFELDEAANRVRDEVDPDANIIVGSTMDPAMEGSMRVSVVATGIDVSNFQSDFRSNSRGLNEKNGDEHSKPMSVSNHNDMRVSKSDNNIRTGYLNRETSEDVEALGSKLASRNDSEEGSKESVLLSESDPFVVEQSGSVGKTARDRLIAAVQKTPEPGQYRRPSLGVNSEPLKSTGGAFNNLIQRMTGNRGHKMDATYDFVTKQTASSLTGTDKNGREKSELTLSDSERLEVPAFLRRQAN